MSPAQAADMREKYGAFTTAVNMLYQAETLQLAANDAPPFEASVFEDVADLIYKAGGFDINQIEDPKVRELITTTAKAINQGIDSALPVDVPDTLRYALEENGFIFSGFKTFHQMREIGLSMLTPKGEIKPYETFKGDALKINTKYNTNYLYAEYKHAIGTSQMAAKWEAMSHDGDRYLLQYRTAEDDRVRLDHKALDGVTLPISDPFWNKYYPPNGWGCRCTTMQVRRGKFQESDPETAMQLGDEATQNIKQRIFRYNAGKEMVLFPPKHPYYKVPKAAKKVIKKVVKQETEKQRKKRYTQELPDTLTQKEKEAIAQNYIDIEQKVATTKGKPMTVEEADKQNANPKHVLKFIPDPNGRYLDKAKKRYSLNPNYNERRDRPFSINCATCAPAYALRLRGFSLTAKGRNGSGTLNDWAAKQHSFDVWKNTDGSPVAPIRTTDWMDSKGYKKMSEKRYAEYFKETCKEQGVYVLTIGWKGGGGHATILQRFADGTLAYIEPQEFNTTVGAKQSISGLCKMGATKPFHKRGILRVDNKIFDTQYLDLFEK